VATSAAPRIRSVPIEPHLTTLDALNVADTATFVNALGFIFEDSPWVAERTWARRPFADIDALHTAMCAVVAAAQPSEQLALIRAHPDLVGRAALAGTLSPASASEQAAAGLDRLDPEEVVMFEQLNAAYRSRFHFPFVICVRENKKSAIAAGLASRVRNERPTEITTALAEIAKIARLRLAGAVAWA
jgi:OHCU decarboxylase